MTYNATTEESPVKMFKDLYIGAVFSLIDSSLVYMKVLANRTQGETEHTANAVLLSTGGSVEILTRERCIQHTKITLRLNDSAW